MLSASLGSTAVPSEVLLWLGAIAVHGTLSKPLKQASKQTVGDVQKYLGSGAGVATGWPESFYAVLNKHRVPPLPGNALQLLNAAFPRLVYLIKKIRDKTWTEKVRLAVGEYVNRSLLTAQPITGRNSQFGFQTQSQKSVATRLGVRPDRLATLLKSKSDVCIPSRTTRNGRQRRYLSSSLIESLITNTNLGVSNQCAAEYLGVPPSRVRLLAGDLLIRTDQTLILQSSLREISNHLLQRVVLTKMTSGDLVSVNHALRYLISQELTSKFFQFLMRNEVELKKTSDESKVGAFLIARSVVLRWRDEAVDASRCFTIPEAATFLGLKQEVLYGLVQKKLINTKPARLGLRSSRVITLEETEVFKRTYAPLVAIAKQSQICSKDAFDWATAIGLPVVTGPRIDGARQYFSLLVTRSGVRYAKDQGST